VANNCELVELTLALNCVGRVGAGKIVDALRSNRNLRLLDLSNNNLRLEGAVLLAEALVDPACPLTSLVLADNKLGAAGIQRLAPALLRNATLTSLGLASNGGGDACMESIAEAVVANDWLTSLDLSMNSVSLHGVDQLLVALDHNTTLTEINLRNNVVPSARLLAVEEKISRNRLVRVFTVWCEHLDQDTLSILCVNLNGETKAALEVSTSEAFATTRERIAALLEVDDATLRLALPSGVLVEDPTNKASAAELLLEL